MLSRFNLKLIACQVAKNLFIESHFEAVQLLTAYQALLYYKVPLTRLDEFWDTRSKKLIDFIKKFTDYLAQHHLVMPDDTSASAIMPNYAHAPWGIFLLALLRLKQHADLEKISAVFTSMFIEEALPRRHYIDAKLRAAMHRYIDLNKYTAELHDDFKAWQDFAALTLPQLAPLTEWVTHTKNIFELLKVKVPEFFMREFKAQFLSSDHYLSPVSLSEFCEYVSLFLTDLPLQGEVLQAYKLCAERAAFDLEAFAQLNVNPFLPLRLQKEYHMFVDLPSVPPVVPITKATGQLRYQSIISELLQDPEKLNLRNQVGGAALLNEQNACAFKAFGHFQLGVRALVQDEAWLSQKLRGIAIHRILERIWDELKTQEVLLNLATEAVDALIHKHVAAVIYGMSRSIQFFIPHSLAMLEVKRLVRIIALWLQQERQRPDFKVLAQEQKTLVYLGALVVQLRLDRIDMLADDTQLVVDYKTGAVNSNDWFSKPIKDLQLPLYILSSKAAGALLAQVNLAPQFSGVLQDHVPLFSEAQHSQALSGKSWDENIAVWQQTVEHLAEEISRGVATVAPIEGACDYCDLHAVCRIKEITSRQS